MPALVVGGLTIPVAADSVNRSRLDAVERRRAFDNTLRASATGGAAREWHLTTPPVTRALADVYEATLGIVSAQLCSGDILGIPTMCCAAIDDGWHAIKQSTSHLVQLPFTLSEVQPAKALLKYAPGDTITGESFTRSTTARYYDNSGIVQSAAINVKRDGHYIGSGVRTLLIEDARTNNFSKSQEFDHADWTKADLTVTANSTNGPDGTATAEKLEETATTAAHFVSRATTTTASTAQAFSVFAKAGTRDWIWIQTNLRDGTTPRSYFNLTTGASGTVAAGHALRKVALANGWYRIEIVVNSGAGGGATSFVFGPTFQDASFSYLGGTGFYIYAWGAQHEQDKSFATSYIATTTAALARGQDLYYLPFTTPPQEMTVYSKFIEQGTITGTMWVWEIGSAAGANPRYLNLAVGGFYAAAHNEAAGNVASTMAVPPVFGDTVELLSPIYGDGSVQLSQSIAGAVAVPATQSGPNPLPAAWADQRFYIGSVGGSTEGFAAFQSFKIVAGARSLAEMRTA